MVVVSQPGICGGIIVDSEDFCTRCRCHFLPHVHQSLVRSVHPTCHGTHLSHVDVLLECLSLFQWSTNTHCCLQVCQELFKSAVNSESIKITSHPEVFLSPGQCDQKSIEEQGSNDHLGSSFSCTRRHQTCGHQRALRLHSTLAQSWDCSFAWCCSKTNSTNRPSLGSSLDQSTDHTHSTTHRQVVAVVLLLPSSTRQFLVGLR